MFAWFTDWLRERRIAADFKKVDAAARRALVEKTRAQFSTTALETEAAALMEPVLAEAARRFDDAQRACDKRGSNLRRLIATSETWLSLLTRDYRTELDALYAEMRECKARLNELYAEKDEAYQALDEAQDDLDGWYRKSRRNGFFGNGGKRLPKHALFSQSLGDRAGYQSDRDDAYAEIAACREAIGDLKASRKAIYDSIQKVKRARQEMFELKKRGHSAHSVERDLVCLRRATGENAANLRRVKKQREEFVKKQAAESGALAIQTSIKTLRQQCADLIAAFDTSAAVAARQRAHREHWLKQHG